MEPRCRGVPWSAFCAVRIKSGSCRVVGAAGGRAEDAALIVGGIGRLMTQALLATNRALFAKDLRADQIMSAMSRW